MAAATDTSTAHANGVVTEPRTSERPVGEVPPLATGDEEIRVARAGSTAGDVERGSTGKMVDLMNQPEQLGGYQLVSIAGEGRSSVVYQARSAGGQLVAVKVLKDQSSTDAAAVARFHREATLADQVEHSNLMKVIEEGTEGNRHFIVMEYFPSQSLLKLIKEQRRLDEEQAVAILLRAGEALAALHYSGIAHRMIKPGNILVGESGAVRLVGLDHSRLLTAAHDMPRNSMSLGTVQYLAPEQVRNSSHASIPADIYALGATFYTMLTGRYPFAGRTLQQIVREKQADKYNPPEVAVSRLSRGAIELIRRTMSSDPTRRPQSLRQMAAIITGGREKLGQYELLEQIGQGHTGQVFRAVDADQQVVAVKTLSSEIAEDETRLLRFYQEAKLSMKLNHPHLVQALEVGTAHGRHFMAMQYVDGDNLAWHIKSHGPLPPDEAIRISLQVCGALQEIHYGGMIHRDVKLSNVLLGRDGESKLTDLGFAKDLDENLDLTLPQRGLGTPQFMAPEQFHNARGVDSRADVYGMGVTLYGMLTGRMPFRGNSLVEKLIAKSENRFDRPEDVVAGIGQRLSDVVCKAMASEPEDRQQSVADLIDELEQCVGLSDVAPPSTPRVAAPPAAATPASTPPARSSPAAAEADSGDAVTPANPAAAAAADAAEEPSTYRLNAEAGGDAGPQGARFRQAELPEPAVSQVHLDDGDNDGATGGSWYVTWQDDSGANRRFIGTREEVCTEVESGRVAASAQVAFNGQHPFRSLADVPEFAAVLHTATVPAYSGPALPEAVETAPPPLLSHTASPPLPGGSSSEWDLELAHSGAIEAQPEATGFRGVVQSAWFQLLMNVVLGMGVAFALFWLLTKYVLPS